MTAQPGEARVAGWPWPESLDALTAAPQHHALLLETEHVRVLETRIPSGERVPVHTHRWPSVLYVVSWGDFLRCDENGKPEAFNGGRGACGNPRFRRLVQAS